MGPRLRGGDEVGKRLIEKEPQIVTAPYHPPAKYSVTINGHQTSISLEPLFWDMLRASAAQRGVAVNALVSQIDSERIKSPTPPGLAGAIRIWLVHQRNFDRQK